MPGMKWKSKLLLAKIGVTYGTDVVPTAAANAILATDVSISPMEGQDVIRNLERPYMGADPSIPAGVHSRMTFSIELVGSGALGTAPAWGPLLRACKVAQTITPATKVEYSPITDNQEWVDIYFQIDTTRHVLLGSRGTATLGLHLLTPDPKEAWADGLAGGTAEIDIDLGLARAIDTVFLGSLYQAAAGATWSIEAGLDSPTELTLLAAAPLRAPDAAGQFAAVSHAFWTGAAITVRYLRLTVSQPAGSRRLSAGVLLIGKAFVPGFGHEWGAGRKPIDTGSATPLPSGGFATVEGARKGSYSWTFGDLSTPEVDALYALQLDRGETRALLVAEDPAPTAGLRHRLHYGLLRSLRQFERRNPAQTRWEMTIEEWI